MGAAPDPGVGCLRLSSCRPWDAGLRLLGPSKRDCARHSMTPDRAGSRLGRLARVSEVEAGEEVAARSRRCAEIAEHNRRYHAEDAPTISDAEFDELVRDLRRYEEEFPELITPTSPTQQVGSAPSVLFAPVQHRQPMSPLSTTFSAEELVAWGAAAGAPPRRRTGRRPRRLRERAKIDGVAIAALRGGRSCRRPPAARAGGGGRHGQHRHHRGDPATAAEGRGDVQVRGEVYMSTGAFEALNARQPRPASASSSTRATPRPARCVRRTRR